MYSATITKINFNNDINGSPNSSLSSLSSNCSQQQQNINSTKMISNNSIRAIDSASPAPPPVPPIPNTLLQSSSSVTTSSFEKENDSGIEKDDSNSIFIRVSISDQNLQVS